MARGFVLWFTGLSGSGKSTLTARVAAELRRRGVHVEAIDGDEVRKQLSRGLGFSREDRDENIRRIGFVAKLVARSGGCAIAAAISPYRAVRNEVRRGVDHFVEVYTECPLEVLSARDPKGLYRRALAGEIRNFTGVDDPYEPPEAPEVHLHTDRESPEESTRKILARLEQLGLVPAQPGEVATSPLAASRPGLVLPHGGELVELPPALPAPEGQRSIGIGDATAWDVLALASGAYSPLRGFMTSRDFTCVAREMRLENGLPWTQPILLPLSDHERADLVVGDTLALKWNERHLATLTIDELFRPDPADLALLGTPRPSLAWLAGGPVRAVDAVALTLSPWQSPHAVRSRMTDFGWRRVVAIPSSAAPTLGDEYVARAALEFADGLLLQPVGTPDDELPVSVRVQCFERLLRGYFAPRVGVIAPVGAPAKGDAFRRIVHDAIVAKNFGASTVLVDAAALTATGKSRWLHEHQTAGLGIDVVPVAPGTRSARVGGLATARTAPDPEDAVLASTLLELARSRRTAGSDVVRPEVWALLMEHAATFVR